MYGFIGMAVPKISFNIADIYRRHWLEERGQRLDNVVRARLLLASLYYKRLSVSCVVKQTEHSIKRSSVVQFSPSLQFSFTFAIACVSVWVREREWVCERVGARWCLKIEREGERERERKERKRERDENKNSSKVNKFSFMKPPN